ncbi:hypothetical protein RB595_010358 [Gaeumannomyces hyphopodioides]
MSPPIDRNGFHLAIICAFPFESDAIELLFDEIYEERYGQETGDINTYTTGRIGNHAVVLLLFSSMGMKASAVAASLQLSYTNIKLALIVGICGGLPQIRGRDTFLGDVIVSKSIVNHDFGWRYPDEFEIRSTEDTLEQANNNIRGLLKLLEGEDELERLQKKAKANLVTLQAAAADRGTSYSPPPDAADTLFPAEHGHIHHKEDCDDCDADPPRFCKRAFQLSCDEVGCETGRYAPRQNRQQERPVELVPQVFMGRVACSDAIIRSGKHRDAVARERDVIAFEMEGAGGWKEVPCILVKGICDYADGHKNKQWRNFAAATAASVAAAILDRHEMPGGVILGRQGRQVVPDSQPLYTPTTKPPDSDAGEMEAQGTARGEGSSEGEVSHRGRDDGERPPSLSYEEFMDHLGDDMRDSRCTVEFRLPLDEFADLLRNEYDNPKGGQDIGKILTVVGGPMNAYATSSEKYVTWRWREYGMDILKWAQKELLELKNNPGPVLQLKDSRGEDITLIGKGSGSACEVVRVVGKSDEVFEIFQLLLWIVSAFRKPHLQEGKLVLAYLRAGATFEEESGSDGDTAEDEVDRCHRIDIKLQKLEPVRDRSWITGAADCWHHIFRAFVVVNCTVRPRLAQLSGIELPLDLMMRLAGTEYILPFLNSFVLRGPKAVIVPLLSLVDHDGGMCIQWHLVDNRDESNKDDELGMEDVLRRVGSTRLLALKESPELKESSVLDEGARARFRDTVASPKHRHFLGLYPAVEIHLGCNGSNAWDARPPAKELNAPPRRILWGGAVTTGVSYGVPGLFGLTAGTSWILSRTQELRAEESNNIEVVVSNACQRSSVLYDTTKKTAWLVPEAAVMLHMIQAYLHRNLGRHAGGFPDAGIMTQPLASFIVSLTNFLESPDHKIKGDLFKTLSKVFRGMRDLVYTSREGAPLSFHSFSSDRALSGVVFAEAWELFGTREECALRQVQIDRRLSGGWPGMVKDAGKGNKGGEILAFFGHFEHDPIRPAALPGQDWLCRTWFTVPSDRGYLVAPLQCLERLQLPRRPMEFPQGHYWIPSLRNPFRCHGTNCNRLQGLVTSRPVNPMDLPGDHGETAAVVFGSAFDQTHTRCDAVAAAAPLAAHAAVGGAAEGGGGGQQQQQQQQQ